MNDVLRIPYVPLAVCYVSLLHFQSGSDQPFFLKVSFHRPHSPYDPPGRLLNSTPASMLPEEHVSADGGWDTVFRGQPGDPAGCGPTDDAWCGLMPTEPADLGRRAYIASARFVDEWVGNVMQEVEQKGLLNNVRDCGS